MHQRDLERRLEAVSGFDEPTPALEQYRTPAPLAAHLVSLAALHDDLAGRTVVDLGSGTGMLSIGAALAGPSAVVGVEIDPAAIDRARANEAAIDPPVAIGWVRGDGRAPPLCLADATVLMNPPFGAQRSNRHADRAFLEATVRIARVSYSVHNAGSREFVESFAADAGGTVTHAFRASLPLPRQFEFHTAAARDLDAEVFRIEWVAADQ